MDRAAIESRIARCDREIAAALKASEPDYGQGGNLGVLIWELDQRRERECLLDDLVRLDMGPHDAVNDVIEARSPRRSLPRDSIRIAPIHN
jgi:hypothetical protein